MFTDAATDISEPLGVASAAGDKLTSGNIPRSSSLDITTSSSTSTSGTAGAGASLKSSLGVDKVLIMIIVCYGTIGYAMWYGTLCYAMQYGVLCYAVR